MQPGTTFGAYEILSKLGAGGMGEVYRARDTRLDREVALKILPEAVARDPDRIARFSREARTLAALNHPHIAQLHGVEEAGDVRALVMELVEGEDLSTLIVSGAGNRETGTGLPIDEALAIAKQIAEALEAAHDAGIIHRDLKPANIKVRPDGTVKVLDFGLAKALEPAVAAAGDQLLSPTITSPAQMTHAGMILGTAAYMSPEQARGRVLDRRTDVWAFGCVLFEMLTASRAFSGEDVTETLAAIMKSDPPMARLPADTPVEIRRLLTRCLQKDRRLRLQHIGDARLELEDAAHPTTLATSTVAVRPGWRLWLGVAAIALAAVGAGIGISEWRHSRAMVAPLQFAIAPPPQLTFATQPGGGTGVAPQFAVSPDGSSVVFVAATEKGFQLWHRSLSSVDARLLPGSDGAAFPFWSPDSQSVGFFADGKLKRIPIEGGPPSVVCDAAQGRGGTWNSNDVIVFSPTTTGPLQRVTAAGGVPQDISALDLEYGETSHRFPSFLPDGTHFLYAATVGTCCPSAKPARTKIGVLDSMATETLTSVESSVAYGAGHLLYADPPSGTLMAQPFDAANRKLLGEPFAVADGIASEGSRYASFSVSSNGLLVYGRGARRVVSRLTWFDRSSRQLGTVGDPGIIQNMSLAADDRHVAVARIEPKNGNRDIFVIDAATNAENRISFDTSEDDSPTWAPDGRQVLFVGQRADAWAVISKATVAATKEQVLFEHKGLFRDNLNVNDVSADGKLVLLQFGRTTVGQSDLWVLRAGTTTLEPYSQSIAFEGDAAFSPDGKWVAYQSSDVGQRANVYVQPYPATGSKSQISRDVGFKPLWRSDGKELFFLNDDGLMAAPMANGFLAGPARPMFGVRMLGRGGNAGRQYGVTRDGQRFLVNLPSQESASQALTVTTNWLAAVRKN
jgi:eukaryotic-like serine/threonine-protein kinase